MRSAPAMLRAHAAQSGQSESESRQSSGQRAPDSTSRIITRLVLQLIRFYQLCISSWTPPSCRFQPTCSHYTYQAIERFGLGRGLWMGLRRLGRCHPFCPGGYDPVPEALPEALSGAEKEKAEERIESN